MKEDGATPRLWDGMLRLYAAPGVAEGCLEMQETCDADVLLLLVAALLAEHGRHLTPAFAGHLVAESRDWRRDVVLPLRELRRRWRGLPGVAPLRDAVKSLELEAERGQAALLQALLDAGPPLPVAPVGTDLLQANCEVFSSYWTNAPGCTHALAAFLAPVAAALTAKSAG